MVDDPVLLQNALIPLSLVLQEHSIRWPRQGRARQAGDSACQAGESARHGWMDNLMVGYLDGWIIGWMDIWMDGWVIGRIIRWIDGWGVV